MIRRRQPGKVPVGTTGPRGRRASARLDDPGRARIQRVEEEGRQLVRKDFGHRSRIFRFTCGRLMAAREAAAYRRLRGIRGIPRLERRLGCDGLLLEHLPGRPCHELPEPPGDAFFETLADLLSRVRAAGVLHGDVKGNALCGEDGRPVLLDFGASFVVRRWMGPPGRWLLSLGARYDARAVLGLKDEVAPELLTGEELRTLRSRPPLLGVVRLGQAVLGAITRSVAWRGLRRASPRRP